MSFKVNYLFAGDSTKIKTSNDFRQIDDLYKDDQKYRERVNELIKNTMSEFQSIELKYRELIISNRKSLDSIREVNQKRFDTLNSFYLKRLDSIDIAIDFLRKESKSKYDSLKTNLITKYSNINDSLLKIIFIFENSQNRLSDSLKVVIKDEYLNKFNKSFSNSIPIATFAVSDNFFINPNTSISQDHSLGINFSLNSDRILNIWKYMDFYFEYLTPNVSTNVQTPEKWNVNLYSFGLNFSIPRIIKTANYNLGAKFALAHFLSSGHVYNVPDNSMSWSGELLKFEIYFNNPGWSLPLDIYLASNFLHSFSNNLKFNSNGKTIEFGSSPVNIGIGVRICLWRELEYCY